MKKLFYIGVVILSILGLYSFRLSEANVGKASYYSDKFNGRKTASGEIFSNHEYTAAHRTLPFGTNIRVTSLDTGKSVVVRINDRGPFTKGRVLDLSKIAFSEIADIRKGVISIQYEVIED